MNSGPNGDNHYHRYHIATKPAPDISDWPTRFTVKVGKFGLAKELLSEIWHYKFKNWEVITSRTLCRLFALHD
jgi:hypothetical protein